MNRPTRTEHDLLGEREVPADAYWGIHTLRALENYPITGKSIGSYPELVRALALVKQAAARANNKLGQLDATRHQAIEDGMVPLWQDGLKKVAAGLTTVEELARVVT